MTPEQIGVLVVAILALIDAVTIRVVQINAERTAELKVIADAHDAEIKRLADIAASLKAAADIPK